MNRHGFSCVIGAAAACAALVTGCSSTAPGARTAADDALPGWVLVVPASGAERAYYVGGCASAADTTAGVAAALDDARRQVESAARDRILPLVDRAFRESGVEITSTERGAFRNRAVGFVVDRLAARTVRERAFHRACEEPAGVCDIFVLVSVDAAAWGRLATEAVSDLRNEERAAAGDTAFARILDWVLEHSGDGEEAPDGAGEGSRRP